MPIKKQKKIPRVHWIVYMLRCRDGSLYTGITTQLSDRIEKHNSGTGAKYTRGRGPVTLVWSRAVKNGTAARKREAEIKRRSRRSKEQMLSGTLAQKTPPK